MTLKINLDDGIEYAVPAGRRPPGGVQIRKDPETGADVFMYKRKPGIYYSANGLEVSSVMAKRAGFDVERQAAERNKQLKMAEFEANWRAEFAGSDVRIVATRGAYRLEEKPGIGYYVVEIETNERMTKGIVAASEQQGRDWLEQFAGPDPEKGFDGTPESVKPVGDPFGDVQRTGEPGRSGTDRRAGSNSGTARNVRAPVGS